MKAIKMIIPAAITLLIMIMCCGTLTVSAADGHTNWQELSEPDIYNTSKVAIDEMLRYHINSTILPRMDWQQNMLNEQQKQIQAQQRILDELNKKLDTTNTDVSGSKEKLEQQRQLQEQQQQQMEQQNQKMDQQQKSLDDINQKLDDTTEYKGNTVKSFTDAIITATNTLWASVGFAMLGTGNVTDGIINFSIDIGVYVDKYEDIFKIFAYSLVLLFFGITLIEQTLKYELMTTKGAVGVFGRLILSKILIDNAGNICMLIINVFNSLTKKILLSGTATAVAERKIIDPKLINLVGTTSCGIPLVGSMIDFLTGIVMSIPLILVSVIVGIVMACVIIKLILRSFELAMMIAVAPVFFACWSSEVTKQFFKNFLLTFISVVATLVFMAVVYLIGIDWIAEESASSIWEWFTNMLPNTIILVAMGVMMVKPPKVLTNLIR